MNGCPDPDDPYLFTPVPLLRANRHGWTAEAQRCFIAAFAQCGVVAAAARSVGLTPRSVYQLRRRAGEDSGFARLWDAALGEAQCRAMDAANAIGFSPVREEILHRGRHVGWRERCDNRVLLAALHAMDPAAERRPPVTARVTKLPDSPENREAKAR